VAAPSSDASLSAGIGEDKAASRQVGNVSNGMGPPEADEGLRLGVLFPDGYAERP
jgi:hypothetical protein